MSGGSGQGGSGPATGAGGSTGGSTGGGRVAERGPGVWSGPRVLRAPAPLFLERETYRQRRMMDAARLLPLFGAALLLVPVFWNLGHPTSAGAVYLFAVWLGLIVLTAALARRLAAPLRRRATGTAAGAAPAGRGGEAEGP